MKHTSGIDQLENLIAINNFAENNLLMKKTNLLTNQIMIENIRVNHPTKAFELKKNERKCVDH